MKRLFNNIKTAEYLADLGIIERVPHERNQYMLYRKYYNTAKKNGEYIKTEGTARDSCKALLL
ncbi:hypothetical protein [Candidatus Endomicrobiellum agilis]|uniref:hypothetical protein n=1 Tax=Candidatus Endomicrobiellum agilis TaxID=3238957 RepID=UPI003587B4FD|nr:hypothetical protein [Endomicrobium sp.]